jgi:hypothetical protein
MSSDHRTSRHAPTIGGLAERVVALLREAGAPRAAPPSRPARLEHHRSGAARKPGKRP